MPVLGDGFDSEDGLACKEATGGGGEGRHR
jgi:hypothetical protein